MFRATCKMRYARPLRLYVGVRGGLWRASRAHSWSKRAAAGRGRGENVHKRTWPADRIACQRAMLMTPRGLEPLLPG